MKISIIGVIFLLCLALSAGADTFGTMTLAGIVPELIHMSISSNQINLNLQSSTQEPIEVSSVRVWSTCHWTIAVESKNQGFLENSADPTERIGYLFTLGGLTSVPESLSSMWTSAIQEPTLRVGFDLPLSVRLLANDSNLVAGVYEDSLTINIQQL